MDVSPRKVRLASNTIGIGRHDGWIWLLGLGVLQLMLGLGALSTVLLASLASAIAFGLCFLIGGLAQIGQAITDRGWSGFFGHLGVGVLYALVGITFTADPQGGVFAITFVLGVYFLFAGVMRMLLAVELKDTDGWGWMALAASVDLLLGALIWAGWPSSAYRVLGAFVGVELLVHGLSLVMLGLISRQLRPI